MIGIKEENFLLVSSDVHDDDEVFALLAEKASDSRCLAFLYAGDLNIENCLISQTISCRNFLFIPVQGNCDNRWSWTDVSMDLPMYRTCSFKGLKIFISHGHMYWDPDAAGLDNRDFDVVITGHSHVPDLHEEFFSGKRVVFLNPGSPSRPRGRSRASYAVIIFEKNGSVRFEIRDLKGDGLLSQITVAVDKGPVGND